MLSAIITEGRTRKINHTKYFLDFLGTAKNNKRQVKDAPIQNSKLPKADTTSQKEYSSITILGIKTIKINLNT